MHVLQLTQRFSPALGGVETHVLNLASRLREDGVGVEVFTTDLLRDTPFQRLRSEDDAFGFPVERFRAIKVLEAPHGLGIVSPAMLARSMSRRPDLVHAHAYGYFPTFVGAFAKVIRRVPLVITPHSDPGRPTRPKRLFDSVIPALTLRQAQRIIALTHVEANYLERLGVPAAHISIVPNGVHPEEFAVATQRAPHDREPVVLFVGRCYPPQKGLDHLLAAISFLPKSMNVRLRIVGEDWGGVGPLRALSKALGIEGRVAFSGRLSRSELIRAYAAADVFVLPSLFEPFGIVLLEAMAAGLPVVASRVGGIPEVVQDGWTGLLVEPGKPRPLADALERLLGDPSLRDEMGQRGRDRAALFNWTEIARRIRGVYEQAVSEFRG